MCAAQHVDAANRCETACKGRRSNVLPRNVVREADDALMTSNQQTPHSSDRWRDSSAALTRIVDVIAERDDLIVRVVDGNPRAPGVFDPSGACITLDASRVLPADVDQASLDFSDLRSLARVPVVAGVLAHEVGHADHTVNSATEATNVAEWVRLLEEPRIETVMARTRPHTRTWMQASVAHLLGNPAPDSAETAARTLILIGGRLLGGVLDPTDRLDLDGVCGEWLTDRQLAVIATATSVAVELADGDIAGLTTQAKRIADVMGNLTPPAHEDGLSHGGQQSPNDGTATGQPESSGDASQGTAKQATSAGSGLDAAIQQIAEDAAADMRTAAGIVVTNPLTRMKQKARRGRATDVARAARDAQRATHKVTHRPPTAEEHKQAAQLIRMMRRAADRGIDTTTHETATPGGALVSSELVQHAAQRATGATPTATPWRTTTRRQRRQPKLTIGIAADISPSMRAVTDQVGLATWLLTLAARDRGGQASTITWHSTAAVLSARRATSVPVAEVAASSSGLPTALRALDGTLALTARTNQPRLVVVITDAELPNPTEIYSEVNMLTATGVKVLWLTTSQAASTIDAPAGTTATTITDQSQLSRIIGEAATQALRC